VISKKVIIKHLIPFHGIGGVELAAATIQNFISPDIDFNVESIFPDTAATNRLMLWNPLHFIKSLMNLWRAKPNVLIVSLWRAYALGIIFKLLQPKIRLVVFLHFPRHTHLLDHLCTILAVKLSYRVWADSHETLIKRLPGLSASKGRVISFIPQRITSLPSSKVRPVFIFWGRLHQQKGLIRALSFFSAIKTKFASARFLIIGPDAGDLNRLRSEANALECNEAIEFLGPKTFFEIEQAAAAASFYLQTSELEGMAVSVIEAMQLGLVPVVTPVGQIAKYAEHGINAVLINDDITAVEDVLALLNDNFLYQNMRTQAIRTWVKQPLYSESILTACHEVLSN
jgi:glycosyltransferase involved in cell wall biosynthesis